MQMIAAITIVKPVAWVLSFVPAYGLRAAGDVRFSMIVSVTTMWCCRVALCIFLVKAFGMGPMAVWIGMFADWSIPVSYTHLGHHTEWIQTLTPVDAAEYDAVLLPVSDSRAYYDQVADSVHGGQLIFGCNLPKKETGQNLVENVPEFVEYMQEDDTAYHNAVATAEGAVAEAILHSTINLCGAKSLLIGYGRCGKVLADRLMRCLLYTARCV